jgi:hypothetical protein
MKKTVLIASTLVSFLSGAATVVANPEVFKVKAVAAEAFLASFNNERESGQVYIGYAKKSQTGVINISGGTGEASTILGNQNIFMADKNGKNRISIAIREDGTPCIIFYDKNEKITKVIE